MIERLKVMEIRLKEIDELLCRDDIIQDIRKMTELNKERATLEEPVNKYQEYKKIELEIEDSLVLENDSDEEIASFAKENVKELTKKLIHRHPHVFGDTKVNSTDDILNNWDALKKEEKPERKSAMDGISKSQSALMSAQKISKRAVKKGFEWDSEKSLLDCIKSEYREFARAVSEGNREHMEDEMGDIFFATVNLARWHKIDAEQALLRANKKFMTRFRKMEELAVKPLEEYSYEEFDKLWRQAKSCLSENKV